MGKLDETDNPISGSIGTRSVSGDQTVGSESEQSHRSQQLLRLDLPIVGRHTERRLFRDLFQRIHSFDSRAEVILCYGPFGCGKTALVNEVKRDEIKARDLWCSGTCRPSDKGTLQFEAIIEAMNELCAAIHASLYKNKIRAMVRQQMKEDELEMLRSFVPAIEIFIEPKDQLGPVRTSGSGSQMHGGDWNAMSLEMTSEFAAKRFSLLIRQFIGTIAHDSHPLVIFLDDLQFADASSRHLLDSLFRDTGLKHVLIVGTVRSDEEATFEIPEDCKLNISKITLGNLDQQEVNEIVSKTTKRGKNDTAELAALVHGKTSGQPFFVAQYVEMIHREGLVQFSNRTNQIEWDIDKVAARTDVTENVAILLASKIRSMPNEVKVILVVAACLGFSFKLSALDLLCRELNHHAVKQICKSLGHYLNFTSTKQVQAALHQAEEAKLIERTRGDSDSYKFSHDKVLDTVMELLPSGDSRTELQILFGTQLLEQCEINASALSSSNAWMLFTALDILSECPTSSTKIEPKNLAKACLKATKIALSRMDFGGAARYAEMGLSQVGTDEGWNDHYDLCLELTNNASFMHCCNLDTAACRHKASIIFRNARCVEDKVRAYNLYVHTYRLEHNWLTASSEGQRFLTEVDMRIPTKVTVFHVIFQLKKVQKALKPFSSPLELTKLPDMESSALVEKLQLLQNTSLGAMCCARNNLFIYTSMEYLKLTLKHGICENSPMAIAAYGNTLAHLGKFKEAFQYGQAAMNMLKRPGTKPSSALTTVMVHFFLWHLQRPLYESLDAMIRGFDDGMATCDVPSAVYCLMTRTFLGIFTEKRLSDSEKAVSTRYTVVEDFSHLEGSKRTSLFHQVALNIMGKRDELFRSMGIVASDNNDEDDAGVTFIESVFGDREAAIEYAMYNTFHVMVFGIMGKLDLAEQHLNNLKKRPVDDTTQGFMKLFRWFFSGLVHFALASKEGKRNAFHIREGTKYEKKLQAMVKGGATSVMAMSSALKAERLALTGKLDHAAGEFKQAVAAAKDLPMIRAVVLERIGEIHLNHGAKDKAKRFLQKSWNAFLALEARAKLSQMKEKYRHVGKFKHCEVVRSDQSQTACANYWD